MSTTHSQRLSSVLTVISANIKGLSAVKLSCYQICARNSVVSVCISKEHTEVKKARPRIPGMTLIAERPHDKYGGAIFIRDDLKGKSISVTAANHVEVITPVVVQCL